MRTPQPSPPPPINPAHPPCHLQKDQKPTRGTEEYYHIHVENGVEHGVELPVLHSGVGDQAL